jgi:hypothetical protein
LARNIFQYKTYSGFWQVNIKEDNKERTGFTVPYIDDVCVYSRTVEEHASRLANMLQKFDEANLLLHPDKCVFAQSQVQYLRITLSANGFSASPDKVKAVREYPTPANVKDVRAFLRLVSFTRD